MNGAAKIHPYLRESWPRRRTELLAQQAERLIAFELVNERTVEDHYDEAQRLRLHRVIERQVLRGSLSERYAQVLLAVADGKTERVVAAEQLAALLADDAQQAAAGSNQALPDAVARYAAVIPVESWPSLLCMAPAVAGLDRLKADLRHSGFKLRESALERFGIVKVSCPPEMQMLHSVANLVSVQCLADADTPVAEPQPVQITTQMVDVVSMLGLADGMQAEADATLAVLDTGLDLAHPAFRRVPASDYRNFTPGSSEDRDGHGTHVAFIAAGGPVAGHHHVGVAPNVRLIAGKVMEKGVFYTVERILEGMAWAVFDKGADVLSLSLGEERTPPNGQSIWSRACDEAFHQGTIVCVAAGNPSPACPETIVVPADAQNAVAVGAIDKAGRLAPFSAQGSPRAGHPLYGKPNCVAPGVEVMAARSSSSDGAGLLVPYSGTSMAAPAVAGCLALLKSRARSLGWEIPPTNLLEIFYAACEPLETDEGDAYSAEFEIGYGLVNMQVAMARIEAGASVAKFAAPTRTRVEPTPPEPRPEVPPVATDSRPPARTFAPDTCYRCGRKYLSTVGVFSGAQRCPTCGAPICSVCWAMGRRGCSEHPQNDRSAAPERPVQPPVATRPASRTPEELTMPEESAPQPCRLGAAQKLAAEGFFARISTKARERTELVQPVTGKAVSRQDPPQTPMMRFGRVHRVNYSGGAWILAHSPLSIVAVTLEGAGLVARDGHCVPSDNLIVQLGAPDGIDFDDKAYYAVGVFSPVGWPPEWKQHPHITANLEIHLVEHRDGRWLTTSPRGSHFASFFSEAEFDEEARAELGLRQDERLQVAGQQVRIPAFCERWQVSRDAVIAAVGRSSHRFLLVPAVAPKAIQRSHIG